MVVKELRKLIEGFADDMEVIMFEDEGDPFWLAVTQIKRGYRSDDGQMFFDPERFIEEDWDGAENFTGELEEVLVIGG